MEKDSDSKRKSSACSEGDYRGGGGDEDRVKVAKMMEEDFDARIEAIKNAENQNLDIDAFQYEDISTLTGKNPLASQALIKQVLRDFRKGAGTFIQVFRMPVADGGDLEHGKTLFQERLSEQLHKLLGVEPFITRKGEHVPEYASIYEYMYYSQHDWAKENGYPIDASGSQLH
jgi:hypothetical protein